MPHPCAFAAKRIGRVDDTSARAPCPDRSAGKPKGDIGLIREMRVWFNTVLSGRITPLSPRREGLAFCKEIAGGGRGVGGEGGNCWSRFLGRALPSSPLIPVPSPPPITLVHVRHRSGRGRGEKTLPAAPEIRILRKCRNFCRFVPALASFSSNPFPIPQRQSLLTSPVAACAWLN